MKKSNDWPRSWKGPEKKVERNRAFREAVLAGESLSSVARTHGISGQRVRQLCGLVEREPRFHREGFDPSSRHR